MQQVELKIIQDNPLHIDDSLFSDIEPIFDENKISNKKKRNDPLCENFEYYQQQIVSILKLCANTNLEESLPIQTIPEGFLDGSFSRDSIFWILSQDIPSEYFILLARNNVLGFLFPELAKSVNITQNQYHSYDIFYHSIYCCDAIEPQKPIVRLAALFHDLGKVPTRREKNDDITFHGHENVGAKMAVRFCQRIQMSKKDTITIYKLIKNHMFHYTSDWTDQAIRRFYRNIGPELLNDLFLLRLADRSANAKKRGIPVELFSLRNRLITFLEQSKKPTVKDLQINGTILMDKLKITPGPIIGKILKELLLEIENGLLQNEEIDLLNRAYILFEEFNN